MSHKKIGNSEVGYETLLPCCAVPRFVNNLYGFVVREVFLDDTQCQPERRGGPKQIIRMVRKGYAPYVKHVLLEKYIRRMSSEGQTHSSLIRRHYIPRQRMASC